MNSAVQLYDKDGNPAYPRPYYRIGDFLESTNPNNPGDDGYIGTWELYGKGRVTVCIDPNDTDFNNIENTGGTKKHTHDSGTLGACINPSNDFNNMTFATKKLDEKFTLKGYIGGMTKTSGGGSSDIGVEINGSTSSASSLIPYIVVYRWRRIA